MSRVIAVLPQLRMIGLEIRELSWEAAAGRIIG
jgi:hypothetical protein